MAPKVVIHLVKKLSGNMTIGEIGGHFGVSRSSYYRWKAQENNSPIETFHSSLKSETFYLDRIHRTSIAHVIQIVEEYITYYKKCVYKRN